MHVSVQQIFHIISDKKKTFTKVKISRYGLDVWLQSIQKFIYFKNNWRQKFVCFNTDTECMYRQLSCIIFVWYLHLIIFVGVSWVLNTRDDVATRNNAHNIIRIFVRKHINMFRTEIPLHLFIIYCKNKLLRHFLINIIIKHIVHSFKANNILMVHIVYTHREIR